MDNTKTRNSLPAEWFRWSGSFDDITKVPRDAIVAADRHWDTFMRAIVRVPCYVHAMGRWYAGFVVTCGRKNFVVEYTSGTGKTRRKSAPGVDILPLAAGYPSAFRMSWCEAREGSVRYWLSIASAIAAARHGDVA